MMAPGGSKRVVRTDVEGSAPRTNANRDFEAIAPSGWDDKHRATRPQLRARLWGQADEDSNNDHQKAGLWSADPLHNRRVRRAFRRLFEHD